MGHIDESCRRRFEAARLKGDTTPIYSFLPDEESLRYEETLEELILIDMEYRWKAYRKGGESGPPPTLTDYETGFPQTSAPEVRMRLQKELAWLSRLSFIGVGSRIGRYVLREHVGTGAFADVWRAHDPQLDRDIALKFPKAAVAEDPRLRARVQHEASAAGRLDHPGIVSVYAIGEHKGHPFYTAEFVLGATLADRLAASGLSPDELARLVAAVADAAAYAHSASVIHRDIKPSNILMHRVRGPVLADFGLAHLGASANGLTQEGDLLGTPAYMAPEQATGRIHDIGPRTDVYALGVILYEGLTGRRPFDRETPAATLQAVLCEDPTRPSRVANGVPLDLETICLKAMAREADRRYASAAELRDDLRQYLARRPVKARRTGTLGRLALWVRRSPGVAALAATALVGVALVATWGYLGIRAERDQLRIEQGNTRRNLFRALLSDTNGILDAARPGWPERAQARLRDAAHLDVDEDGTELRNLAIRSMCGLGPTLSHVARLPSHGGRVVRVALDASRRRLIAVTEDALLWVRSADDGTVVDQVPVERQGLVDLKVHPSGDSLVLAFASGRIETWSTQPLKRLRTSEGEPVSQVAFHPDGSAIALARVGGEVDILSWNPKGPGALVRSIRAHEGACLALAFSEGGKRFVTGGADNKLRLWDWRLGLLLQDETALSAPPLTVAIGKHVTATGGHFSGATHDNFTPRPAVVGIPGLPVSMGWSHGARILMMSYVDSWLVTASVDGSIAVWDASARRHLMAETGWRGGIVAAACAPETRMMVTAHVDGSCTTWKIGGSAAWRWAAHHACAFQPDSHDLLTDFGVYEHGGPRLNRKPFHVPSFAVLTIDPGRKELICFAADGRVVQRRDAEPFEVIRTWNSDVLNPTCALLLDDRLFIGSASGQLWIGSRTEDGFRGHAHDLRRGAVLRVARFSYMGSGGDVLALTEGGRLRVRADGSATAMDGPEQRATASATAPGMHLSWRHGLGLTVEDPGGAGEARTLAQPRQPLTDICLSSDGKWMTTSDAQRVVLREMPSGRVRTRIPMPRHGRTWFDPTGRFIQMGRQAAFFDVRKQRWLGFTSLWHVQAAAMSTDRATVFLSDARAGLRAWPVTLLEGPGTTALGGAPPLPAGMALSQSGHGHVIWSLATSPDGHWFATSDHWGTVKLWDAKRKTVARTHVGSGGPVWRVAFSPDSKVLAVGIGMQISLLDVSDGRELARLTSHEQLVVGLAFDPKKPRLVSTSLDKTMCVWNLETNTCIGKELLDSIPRDAAFRPDGKELAVACSDGTIRIYASEHLASWPAPVRVLAAHPTEAYAIAYNRAGSLLATGGADGRVVLHVASTGRELCEFETQINVRTISFSHDDQYLAAASYVAGSTSWDLGRIRAYLRRLGIDWTGSSSR